MTEYLDPKFLIETLGLIGIVSIVFAESGLFFGFFLPGDSLLFTAGLLASQKILPIFPLLFLSFFGAILGDSVGYWFGKKIGPKLFSKEDSFFWNKKHIEKSHNFFEKYGKKAIILARFMPIVRTFTPILAGVGSMEYKTFLRYNIIGGFLWVFGMILGGVIFGNIIPNPDKYLLPVIIAIIIISLIPVLKEIIKNKNMRSPEENTFQSLDGLAKKETEDYLKRISMTLNNLGELTPKLRPGSYNENQGVIVFSPDGNNIYATPSNSDTSEKLIAVGYFNDESVGVPNLNNRDTWKDKKSSLAEWEGLQR